MQFQAIIDTLKHVFTVDVVLIIFAIVAVIVFILVITLVLHVKKSDPAKDSMKTFSTVYVAGAIILLLVILLIGLTL